MSIKTTKLPRTQLSGLDYSTIIEDVKSLVTDNPDYNENWDNFLESNAGRMIVELFAYIADQLSTRIDWVANESFISTATQKKSVIRLLKLIGYNFSLPVSAYVSVNAKPERLTGSKIRLTSGYSANSTFSPFSLAAKDMNGYDINFEALAYSEVDKKFLYNSNIDIDLTAYTDTDDINIGVDFYEGKTYVENFYIENDNGPILNLSNSPVTQDSISVYRSGIELLKVNSFLEIEAQTSSTGTVSNPVPYIININENDSVSIEFGPTSLLKEEERRVSIGNYITVIYRVGGGSVGNITEKGINIKKTLKDMAGTNVLVSFSNNVSGIKGEESETIDHALYYAPLSIKTADKTVTEDDYNTILGAYGNMLLAKAYGSNNMPSNFYDKYGLFINPMEVLCFVALKKPGYLELKPSEYNDFKWIDLRLENRFNEELSFNSGSFNSETVIQKSLKTTISNIALAKDAEVIKFKNYLYITPPFDFLDNIYLVRSAEIGTEELNQTMKMILLNSETTDILFDELIDESNSSSWFIKDTEHPCFSLDKETVGSFSIISKEDTYAEVFGGVSFVHFTPAIEKTFSVSLDHRGIVDVDFQSGIRNDMNMVAYIINNTIASTYQNKDAQTNYPYAFGYQAVGATATVLHTLGEKTESSYLESVVFTETGLKIKLSLIRSSATEDVELTIDLTSNLDDSPNVALPVTFPAGEEFYKIYDESSGTPVANETSFNPRSLIDITKIINRTFVSQDIDLVCKMSNSMQGEENTCYGMFIMPLLTNYDNEINPIKGVKIQPVSNSTNDLFWYLSGASSGGYLVPNEKKWADYSKVVSVITADFNGTNKSFLYMQSPVIGEEYSNITTTTKSENVDCLFDIFGLANHGSCNGIRRVSLITNDELAEVGNIIYEINSFSIPYYFSDLTLTFTDDAIHNNRNIVINNKLYINYVRDSQESLQLGNTTDYFKVDTVHNIYNSVIDSNGEIDINLSSFDMRFTKKKEDINSIYAIDNLSSEKVVTLQQAGFAKKDSLQAEMDGVFSLPAFTSNDSISFSIDFEDETDEDAKFCFIQLSPEINSLDELFTLIYSLMSKNEVYEGVTSNFLIKDPVRKIITIKNNKKDNDGVLKFYADDNVLNEGFNKIFGGSRLEQDLVIKCSGDYYLSFVDKQVFINKMTGSVNVPDSRIYAHYISDRRNEKDAEGQNIILEEDALISYLYPYKVLSIENSLKIPRFKTFDIAGKVFFNSLKTANDIKEKVETAIRSTYNLSNSDFGISIVKSKIFKIIHSIDGVEYAEISYLGYDYVKDPAGVDNILVSDFDQIPIVCEDITGADGTSKIHGIMFSYEAI